MRSIGRSGQVRVTVVTAFNRINQQGCGPASGLPVSYQGLQANQSCSVYSIECGTMYKVTEIIDVFD